MALDGEKPSIRLEPPQGGSEASECIAVPIRATVTLSSGNTLNIINDSGVNALMQLTGSNNFSTRFLSILSEDGDWHQININLIEDIIFSKILGE